MDTDYRIRRGRSDDVGFILKSWLRSYNEHIRPEERKAGYWDGHKEVIATLLERSRVVVAACPLPPPPGKRELWQLYGFAVGERHDDRLVLHYVYTKDIWRGCGIARALITHLRDGAQNVVVTHVTGEDVRKYCQVRGWGFARNAPFYHALAARRERERAA